MVYKILNHIKVAQEEYARMGLSNSQMDYFGYANDNDYWFTEHIDKDRLAVYTIMDNFDMEYFFQFIKLPKEAIIEKDDDAWKYMK